MPAPPSFRVYMSFCAVEMAGAPVPEKIFVPIAQKGPLYLVPR